MALRADDVDVARDRELVDRFQSGQVDAFEDLYTRYYGRVRRLCMRRVGDTDEAEEITQEVFARAYVAFPRLGGPRHAYAWLSVVASRLCVDTHRRRARTQPTNEVDRGESVVDDDRLEAEVDVDHLRAALARLTPRHREVLALREQQEWSYQRIADHYGVTLGTVEALLFRARGALRREFAAVSGTRRDLAAIPLIGVVFKRLAGLRARVDHWLPSIPSVPYAELTTIVALMTGVGVAIGSDSRPPAPAPATVTVTAAGDDGYFDGLDRSRPSDAEDRGSTPTDHVPVGGTPDPAGTAPTEIPKPETMDFETARRNAEESPAHASNDHIAVGIDADEAVDKTVQASKAYAGQMHDFIEGTLP